MNDQDKKNNEPNALEEAIPLQEKGNEVRKISPRILPPSLKKKGRVLPQTIDPTSRPSMKTPSFTKTYNPKKAKAAKRITCVRPKIANKRRTMDNIIHL
jgi:hypothetical protein